MQTGQLLVKFFDSSVKFNQAGSRVILDSGIEFERLEAGTSLPGTEEYFSKLPDWLVYDIKSEVATWNDAHQLRLELKKIGNAYVEPDIIHQFDYYNKYDEGKCIEGDYDDFWPSPPPDVFAWYLDDDKTELLKARNSDTGAGGSKIRIAHLDTGYDPKHDVRPLYLNFGLQNNFTKGETGTSAIDRMSTGIGRQPGHGPGTIAILSGNHIKRQGSFDNFMGATPFADVVPVRISPSVILLRTVAFAKGVKYALTTDCNIITMSMGGLASKVWADVVNEAYEAGVTVISAAGNNFGGLPIRKMVYPARFERVIGVCGVTYDNTPYFKTNTPLTEMQGCWGPARLMHFAMAAYTPNVPWALFGCVDKFSKSGAGTSSATPQVAGAASLLAEKYMNESFPYKWQRTEAIRTALFESADVKGNEFKKVGRGVVQAKKALDRAIVIAKKPAPIARVRFPLFTLLAGLTIKEITKEEKEMYEVELAQLADLIPELRNIMADIDDSNEEEVSDLDLDTIRTAILHYSDSSEFLKKAIQ